MRSFWDGRRLRRPPQKRPYSFGGVMTARLLLGLCVVLLGGSVRLSGQTLFQAANPHYPERNPFYFEGRIDWELLKIDVPGNAWEFAQRGIHRQDDLEDIQGAIADYRQ